jgi:hypothetical protein
MAQNRAIFIGVLSAHETKMVQKETRTPQHRDLFQCLSITWLYVQSDSKLLSEFLFIGHRNPDNNLESLCMYAELIY